MGFTVDKLLCIGCGACVAACSKGIFTPDADGKMDTLNEPCLNCFHCTAACPTKAVGCDGLTEEQLYGAFSAKPLPALMQKRRSIRNFGRELPEKLFLQEVLDCAAYAPSARNEHPTRWVIVLSREKMDKLFRLTVEWAKRVNLEALVHSVEDLGRNPVTCGSSCAVIGCCRKDACSPETDTAIAVTHAELLLTEAGWGTCWSGYLRRGILGDPAIRALAGIPEGYDPYAVLLVGKAQGEHYLRPAYHRAAEIKWTE